MSIVQKRFSVGMGNILIGLCMMSNPGRILVHSGAFWAPRGTGFLRE